MLKLRLLNSWVVFLGLLVPVAAGQKKKSFNLFGFYLSLKGLQDIGGELMYFYHRRVVKIHIIGIFLLC